MANPSTLERSPLMRLAKRLSIGGFWRWWIRGLGGCLPASLRRRLVDVPREVILELDADHTATLRTAGGEVLECQPLDALTPEHLGGVLRRFRRHRRVLRLPPQRVLLRDLELPLAAGANLYKVVGFDIDRLTPFKAEAIHYAVALQHKDPVAKRLTARLAVVRRKVLEELLEQLKQRAFIPGAVGVVGEAPGLDLLPVERRPRRRRGASQVQALAVVGLLALVGGAALLPLWQQRQLVLELLPQVEAAQRRAEVIFTLRQERDRAVVASQFLLQRRLSQPLAVDVLRDVTARLPDDTYLEQLDLRNDEIQMRGQSSQATRLVELLEDSPLFEAVVFRSPITTDRRTGRERFYLTARLVANPEADTP